MKLTTVKATSLHAGSILDLSGTLYKVLRVRAQDKAGFLSVELLIEHARTSRNIENGTYPSPSCYFYLFRDAEVQVYAPTEI